MFKNNMMIRQNSWRPLSCLLTRKLPTFEFEQLLISVFTAYNLYDIQNMVVVEKGWSWSCVIYGFLVAGASQAAKRTSASTLSPRRLANYFLNSRLCYL